MKYLHTMVRITDVSRSLAFYCDALGLDRLWYEAPDAQKKREGLSDPLNVESHGSVSATPLS